MLHKYDIINALGRARGATRYFEICTPSTGVRFAFVDANVFSTRHRLMYRCPDPFEDGADITFRTVADHSRELIRAIDATLPLADRYDIIFVDPFHTLAASLADLHGALCLLRPGGVLVVHDCNPTDPDLVSEEFRKGGWCGVTYQAFIDFALSVPEAATCVIDTDYGCGLIFTDPADAPGAWRLARPSRRLVFEWVLAREAAATRFAFFDRHRGALLNLIGADAFKAVFGAGGVAPAALLEHHPTSALGPDPALLVRAGGAELPLASYDAGWHRYTLPEGATEIELVSPVFNPTARDPASPDDRPLGVAVAALRIAQGGAFRPLRLSDPALIEGWHTEEASAGYPWRWTNGQAKLMLPARTTSLDVFTHRADAT